MKTGSFPTYFSPSYNDVRVRVRTVLLPVQEDLTINSVEVIDRYVYGRTDLFVAEIDILPTTKKVKKEGSNGELKDPLQLVR